MSTFGVWTPSESSQTPVQTVLAKRCADVGDQGLLFWRAFLPLSFIEAGLWNTTQLPWWPASLMLPLDSKRRLFFPYDRTVWEPQLTRQMRKLDLDSPPPTCLWNLCSPEEPLALAQIWSSCHKWPRLGSCCSPHRRGGYSETQPKLTGQEKSLKSGFVCAKWECFDSLWEVS